MRIRVPQGFHKDQFYVVLILGTITGLYNWKGLLQEHLKEQFERELAKKEKSNEVKQIVSLSLRLT